MRWNGLAVGAFLTAAGCHGPNVGPDASFERLGATFVPVEPCTSEADYVPGSGGLIRLTTDPMPAYVPNCVKITTLDVVSIQASVEHPVIGTMEMNASDVSPISTQVTMADTTYTFAVTGFYSFECPTEKNMKGVIWVGPP